MQSTTALWVALTLTSIGFAGCTGGGELDMLVTPSDDPVTEPFHFEATGPKYETYSWNFNDGTVMEGAEVDHLFGFTNGKVVVRLTAENAGEEPNVILREVDLGGSENVPVDGVLATSSFWIDPNEAFSVSAVGSSDPDGDPLLYRWTCQRAGDLQDVDTSHPPHEGFGGVPFGVDAWAVLDPNVTADEDRGSDFCGSLDPTNPMEWSLDMDSLAGTITESGVYEIELFVRDPKSPPHVTRLGLYVSDTERLKPEPTQTEAIAGTFMGGAGGGFQGIYDDGVEIEDLEIETPPPSEAGGEQTFDRIEHAFEVDMNSLEGAITFDYNCGGEDCGETTAQYRIYVDGSTQDTISATSQGRDIGKDDIKAKASGFPQSYILEIQVVPAGAQVTVDFDMTFTKDIDPLNWYELPPV